MKAKLIAAIAVTMLGVLAMEGCTKATAQTPTYSVSLTLPSQNTDGSSLPVSQITSYTIAYKVGAATTYTTKVVNGPFTVLTQTTTIPKPFGTTCANAYVTANGMTSAATSPDVCVTNLAPPSPPSSLTVN